MRCSRPVRINRQVAVQIGLVAFFLINTFIFVRHFSFVPSGQSVEETLPEEEEQSGRSNVATIPEVHFLPAQSPPAPPTKSLSVSFAQIAVTGTEKFLGQRANESEENRMELDSAPSKDDLKQVPTTLSPGYASPWTWSCGDDGKCHRVMLYKSSYMSLESCWLTCGPTRGLWPRPRSRIPGKFYLGKKTMEFTLGNFRMGKVEGPSSRVRELGTEAFAIMKRNLKFKFLPSNDAGEKGISGSVSVSLRINSTDDLLTLLTDETYRIRVILNKESSKHLSVVISGETFFGVRHGLETLSQLIVFDDAVNSLKILSEVDLRDGPAFPYRGLMIDSGRNFISIDSLRRMIDGMGQNKLNILHWHLSDSNSFPLFIPSLPEMTNYGAYSKEEIYQPQEIKDLLDYALVRGVKVIPEIDAPAHAGNGWQWGNEVNGHGQLALCVNEEPWNSRCGQPPCGQLNPANPKVYKVLHTIYSHILTLFDPDLFHMGGDEVTFTCWKTLEIRKFMKANRIPNFLTLRTFFQSNAYHQLKMAASKSNSSSNQKGFPPVPIIWTSGLTAELSIRNTRGISPTDYIIQTWEGSPRLSAQVRELLAANYPLIISNVGEVYLDLGTGTWLGRGHDWRYINWQDLYGFDFDMHGYNTKKRVNNSRFGDIPQILGGEAPLWTEKVNEFTMDAKLWPRGAAFAERLWMNPNLTETMSPLVYARLLYHNERMRRTGIHVDTRQPKSCLLIDGNCENQIDPYPETLPQPQPIPLPLTTANVLQQILVATAKHSLVNSSSTSHAMEVSSTTS